MKYIWFLVFLFCSQLVVGQVSFYAQKADTIYLNQRVGGSLDSIDIAFTRHSSTFVDGGSGKIENTLPITFFNSNYGGGLFRNYSEQKKMRFSALPHLGFGYAFGTQGNQYVTTNYQQAFKKGFLVNIDYDLMRSNGFLRNSITNQHDVQLQLQKLGTFYSFKLSGGYIKKDFGLNGGITTDTLIDNFGLAFTPVRKADAQSNIRLGNVKLEHYFDFLSKDSLSSLGLYIENEIRVFNRKYSEQSDTLFLIYGLVNYDSLQTNDQYQLSESIQSAGVFFKSKRLFFKGGIQSNYWKYTNLGYNHDTLELNLDGQIKFETKALQVFNRTNFNVVGAAQEWYSNSSIALRLGQFSVNGLLSISNLLPEQYQRYYYGNSLNYLLPTIQKQFRSNLKATIDYKIKQQSSIGAIVATSSSLNNYFFNNTTWQRDSVKSLNYFQVGVIGKTAFKAVRTSLQASYLSGNYVPSLLVQSRLSLQGRILKGRKLLAQIGVEGSFKSDYELLSYTPMMDAFILSNTSVGISPQQFNLHVFGGFEISQFRFFFRVENIGYTWNDRKSLILNGYPIPAMNIRLGITWDFFN